MARTDGLIHSKLPHDAVIHTRQPVRPETKDEEAASLGFTREGYELLSEQVANLARAIENRSNLVDEYNTAAISGAGSSASVVVQPTFEYMPEKIESIVITGPALGSSILLAGTTGTGLSAGSLIAGPVALTPGSYTINWSTLPGGTVGAAEKNNYGLYVNGVLVQQSSNPQNAGTTTSQLPYQLTTSVPVTLTVNVVNTPTSTASYSISGTINPTGNGVQLQLGDRIWQLVIPPSGILTIGYTGIVLSRTDARILTPGSPGVYTLELCGIADKRFNI